MRPMPKRRPRTRSAITTTFARDRRGRTSRRRIAGLVAGHRDDPRGEQQPHGRGGTPGVGRLPPSRRRDRTTRSRRRLRGVRGKPCDGHPVGVEGSRPVHRATQLIRRLEPGPGGNRRGMPDITTIIENDHREVERLFDSYRTGPPAERQDVVDRIRVTLAQHAAAEEILVYPTVRRTAETATPSPTIPSTSTRRSSDCCPNSTICSADDPAQSATIAELERAVAEHVRKRSPSCCRRSGAHGSRAPRAARRSVRGHQAVASDPSAPGVPGTASAQLLAGPLASVADRIRDFVAR
jgi:hypothetical protein